MFDLCKGLLRRDNAAAFDFPMRPRPSHSVHIGQPTWSASEPPPSQFGHDTISSFGGEGDPSSDDSLRCIAFFSFFSFFDLRAPDCSLFDPSVFLFFVLGRGGRALGEELRLLELEQRIVDAGAREVFNAEAFTDASSRSIAVDGP